MGMVVLVVMVVMEAMVVVLHNTSDYVSLGAVIVKTPTPTQHNTTVGFDTKMTVHTPPTTHHPQKLFSHF